MQEYPASTFWMMVQFCLPDEPRRGGTLLGDGLDGVVGAAGGAGVVGFDTVSSLEEVLLSVSVSAGCFVDAAVSGSSVLDSVVGAVEGTVDCDVPCLGGREEGRSSEPLPLRGDVGLVTLSLSPSRGGFEPSRMRRPIVLSSSGTSLALAGIDA